MVEAKQYIANRFISSYQILGFGLMVMVLRKSDNPIGLCGLLQRDYLENPDLGFAVLPNYQGKGYVTEASSMVIDHAFNHLGLEQIHGITLEDNERSRKLLLNLGFKFDRKINPKSEDHELLLYSIGPSASTPNLFAK